MPLHLVILSVSLRASHLSRGKEDQCPLAVIIDAAAIVQLRVFLSLQIDGIIAEQPLGLLKRIGGSLLKSTTLTSGCKISAPTILL